MYSMRLKRESGKDMVSGGNLVGGGGWVGCGDCVDSCGG